MIFETATVTKLHVKIEHIGRITGLFSHHIPHDIGKCGDGTGLGWGGSGRCWTTTA
jgi:hypothetical protein